MARQKLAVWMLVLYVVILGVLAWLGAPYVAIAFYALMAVLIIAHTIWTCPRCRNYGCAINPRSPYFLFGVRQYEEQAEQRPGLNNNLPFLILAVALVLALYAVWMFNPFVCGVMAVIGAALLYNICRDACRSCPNKCLLNRNQTKLS